MDPVNVYAGCNLNDLNNPARPQRPDSPDENNASGTFSRMCRQVASLQPGAVGPAVQPRETDRESFIPNIPGPAHFSGSGTFDVVSQTSLASAGKVTSERDKPPIEEHWYQKDKMEYLLDNLLPKKYWSYLFQEGVIKEDEMHELRALRIRRPRAETLVQMLEKKYKNPGLFGLTKEKILETIFTALGKHQSFLQDCLNKEYLETHPGSLKSNTSSGNQRSVPEDRRNAQYAAAGRKCAYKGETRQGCEHDDQGLMKKGGKGSKDDTNNKFSNVKDSFPVQESSVPQQPSLLQAPLRFYP